MLQQLVLWSRTYQCGPSYHADLSWNIPSFPGHPIHSCCQVLCVPTHHFNSQCEPLAHCFLLYSDFFHVCLSPEDTGSIRIGTSSVWFTAVPGTWRGMRAGARRTRGSAVPCHSLPSLCGVQAVGVLQRLSRAPHPHYMHPSHKSAISHTGAAAVFSRVACWLSGFRDSSLHLAS